MSVALRLRTWWRAPDLDRELAAGTEPSSAELQLRAAQLTDPVYLAALAEKIENVVDESNRRDRTALALSLQDGGLVAVRAALLGLAERLREGEVPAAAAAIASRLVYSTQSPLYTSLTDESAWELASKASGLIDRRRHAEEVAA
jgi:hypothetical protein